MNKRYAIAVDFDGTLVESRFPEIICVRKHIVKALLDRKAELEMLGYSVYFILWTCREDIPEGDYLTQAVNYVKENISEIELTYINRNPECDFGHPEKVRKIVANEYWDDLAVRVS